MSYAEHLIKLLRPLGVYDLSDGSLSGSELYAVGQALDAVNDTITASLQNAIPATADKDTLQTGLRLFSVPSVSDTETCRAVLLWFLQARGRDISQERLNSLLALYYPLFAVSETGVNTASVALPAAPLAMTLRWKNLVEKLLPCQIKRSYDTAESSAG